MTTEHRPDSQQPGAMVSGSKPVPLQALSKRLRDAYIMLKSALSCDVVHENFRWVVVCKAKHVAMTVEALFGLAHLHGIAPRRTYSRGDVDILWATDMAMRRLCDDEWVHYATADEIAREGWCLRVGVCMLAIDVYTVQHKVMRGKMTWVPFPLRMARARYEFAVLDVRTRRLDGNALAKLIAETEAELNTSDMWTRASVRKRLRILRVNLWWGRAFYAAMAMALLWLVSLLVSLA